MCITGILLKELPDHGTEKCLNVNVCHVKEALHECLCEWVNLAVV